MLFITLDLIAQLIFNFTSINKPTTLTGIKATGDGSYYYNSQSYVENKAYTEGVWCKYYYHVAVTPSFKE